MIESFFVVTAIVWLLACFAIAFTDLVLDWYQK